MKNEKMLVGANQVGKRLMDGLLQVRSRRKHVGDVRGKGMAIGVEIVVDKISKMPFRSLADELMYKMKERKVLVNVGGIYKNVVTLTPPLCFTLDNAQTFVKTLDELLEEIEAEEAVEEAALEPVVVEGSAFSSSEAPTTALGKKRKWKGETISGCSSRASTSVDIVEFGGDMDLDDDKVSDDDGFGASYYEDMD